MLLIRHAMLTTYAAIVAGPCRFISLMPLRFCFRAIFMPSLPCHCFDYAIIFVTPLFAAFTIRHAAIIFISAACCCRRFAIIIALR